MPLLSIITDSALAKFGTSPRKLLRKSEKVFSGDPVT